MRIGIDIRYLSHNLLGGVHTYVRDLVPALIDAAPDEDFVLYYDGKARLEIVPPARVTMRELPWLSGLSSVYNDRRLAHWMGKDALDIAHFPANYGFAPRRTCAVITVHDALNLLPISTGLRGFGNPRGLRTAAMVCYLSAMTRAAVRRATLLLTVSEHAKQEIAARAQWPRDRIAVVPHGAPLALEALPTDTRADELLRPFDLKPGFVLADALKNPGVLLEAWRLLEPAVRDRHALIFFARRPDVHASITNAVSRGEARLLVRPTREELTALYTKASVFAFPSWIEGFGLPLLEAMAFGAPIVASNRGSIPEVAGDAAILVDAEDAAALAASLALVLTSEQQRNDLRSRGRRRVKDFSWRRAAEQTLDAYRHALTIHRQAHR